MKACKCGDQTTDHVLWNYLVVEVQRPRIFGNRRNRDRNKKLMETEKGRRALEELSRRRTKTTVGTGRIYEARGSNSLDFGSVGWSGRLARYVDITEILNAANIREIEWIILTPSPLNLMCTFIILHKLYSLEFLSVWAFLLPYSVLGLFQFPFALPPFRLWVVLRRAFCLCIIWC